MTLRDVGLEAGEDGRVMKEGFNKLFSQTRTDESGPATSTQTPPKSLICFQNLRCNFSAVV